MTGITLQFKRACSFGFFVISIFGLTSCYVLSQAPPFLTHHLGARPNERIIADEKTDRRTVEFLKTVEDIRAFAVEELGLKETKNYTKFYDLDKDYLAAVVQAAPEFSIDPYLFQYPVVGKLPYRGFYQPDDARKEAQKLKEQGLDVWVRPVDAFSSLGYFRDPLFSFMVDYSRARLAELIIHEQTHATMFLKGEADFNEKLATFVGREGARQYVVARFGRAGEEYRRLLESRRDAERYTKDMFALGRRLSVLYDRDISDESKRRLKKEIIEQFQREFAAAYEERYETDTYEGASELELNNAYLSLFKLYEEPDNTLQRLLDKAGGIRRMMELLASEFERGNGSPWEAVDGLLENG